MICKKFSMSDVNLYNDERWASCADRKRQRHEKGDPNQGIILHNGRVSQYRQYLPGPRPQPNWQWFFCSAHADDMDQLVQSYASPLSQCFAMFFHLSCKGLTGQ